MRLDVLSHQGGPVGLRVSAQGIAGRTGADRQLKKDGWDRGGKSWGLLGKQDIITINGQAILILYK